MPEYPDVTVYIESLEPRIVDQILENVRFASPFLLRTVEPPIAAVKGKKVVGLRRIGKRIVFALEEELFLVIHLMIAGRFRWKPKPARRTPAKSASRPSTFPPARSCSPKRAPRSAPRSTWSAAKPRSPTTIAAASSSSNARLAAVPGRAHRENHTLKRALTDPTLFSGIGNAYSDEILHRARLSPVKLTHEARPTRRSRGSSSDARRRSSSGPSACAKRPATASPRR